MLARASSAECERIGGRELSAKELEQRLKNGQALFARMEHQISPSTAPIYESPCTAFLPEYSQLEPALPIYLSANYAPVVATLLLVFWYSGSSPAFIVGVNHAGMSPAFRRVYSAPGKTCVIRAKHKIGT